MVKEILLWTSTCEIANSNVLFSGAADGSMYALVPIDIEETAKRLQLLQGQLTRNMQHVAGLNPRAFRCATHYDYEMTYVLTSI